MPTDRDTYPASEYLPIGEVAKYFGVSVITVRRWEARGHLASVRTPGGQRRFKRAAVESFLDPEEVA